MTMIHQTIESLPPRAFWRYVLLGGAAVFLLVSVATSNVFLALLAVPFVTTAFALWCVGWKRIRATFTDKGLEVERPAQFIAYGSVQGLQAHRPVNPYVSGRRSYPIRVLHADGVLDIPQGLNVPADEVYSFLYHQLTSCGSPEVQPALQGYLRRQTQRYGPERVWSYARRAYTGGSIPSVLLKRFAISLLLTGPIWSVLVVTFIEMNGKKWEGYLSGFLCPSWLFIVIGATLTLMLPFRYRPYKTNSKKRKSGLVICPEGLALCQGELVGEIRWEEIRRVWANNDTVVLSVPGANITIHDVYDRPLPVIHQVIWHYYTSPDRAERANWKFDATRFRDLKDQAMESDRYSRGRD